MVTAGLGFVLLVTGVIFLTPLQIVKETRSSLSIPFIALGIGAFLVVPHRRVFACRLAPFWLALSFLLPAASAVGIGRNLWFTFKTGYYDTGVVIASIMWLGFLINAEHCAPKLSFIQTDERSD